MAQQCVEIVTQLVDDDGSPYFTAHGFPDQCDIIMPLMGGDPPSQDSIDSMNEEVTNEMKNVRMVCNKLVDGLPPAPPAPPPPPPGTL